jgi:hypothetical protein
MRKTGADVERCESRERNPLRMRSPRLPQGRCAVSFMLLWAQPNISQKEDSRPDEKSDVDGLKYGATIWKLPISSRKGNALPFIGAGSGCLSFPLLASLFLPLDSLILERAVGSVLIARSIRRLTGRWLQWYGAAVRGAA